MTDAIIVVNAGSTSLKFGAYGMDTTGSLPLLCRGQVDSMQGDPHFVAKNAAGKPLHAHEWREGHAIDHRTALNFVIMLEANIANLKVRAPATAWYSAAPASRRRCGSKATCSTISIRWPQYSRCTSPSMSTCPGLPQVASFDTSFHRTMPAVAQTHVQLLSTRKVQ